MRPITPGHRAAAGAHRTRWPTSTIGIPAPDLAEAQVALVVDVRDVQPDLVDVTDHGQRRPAGGPGNPRERGAEMVGAHVLRERRAALPPDAGGIGLVAGRTGRCQQAFQELGDRHAGEG